MPKSKTHSGDIQSITVQLLKNRSLEAKGNEEILLALAKKNSPKYGEKLSCASPVTLWCGIVSRCLGDWLVSHFLFLAC